MSDICTVQQASTGYFDTLGVKLVSGRTFEPTDAFGRQPVVVINDAMAHRCWPDESPLGKRIVRTDRIPLEVIGVVRDVSFPGHSPSPTRACRHSGHWRRRPS